MFKDNKNLNYSTMGKKNRSGKIPWSAVDKKMRKIT